MPRTQDVQDLIEHIAATEGVHHMTKTPTPDGVPVAYFDGTIDNNWISDNILKVGDKGEKLTAEDLPDNVIWLVNGKIPAKYLPSTIKATAFQSGGSKTHSNYYLADGTDLIDAINQIIGSGQPLTGYGNYMGNCNVELYNNTNWYDNGRGGRNYSLVRDLKISLQSGELTLEVRWDAGNCNCCDSC
jgi:hypothetical protein